MSWPWSELGLPGPSDLAAVRHAYAECLKTTHPEEDPEGFQQLNEAYQEARKLARRGSPVAAPSAPSRTRPEAPKPPPPEANPSPALDELFRTPPLETPLPLEETPAWELKYAKAFELEQTRRAEEREQAAQARRAAFFAKFPTSTPEQRAQLNWRWVRIEAAQTMAEVLLDSGATLEQWMDYLHSSVFLIIKGDSEFVAGFEEFLRDAAGLPDYVKRELLRAFSGIDTQQVPQVWHGIHQILSGQTPPQSKPTRRFSRAVPFWKARTFRLCMLAVLVLFLGPLALHLGPVALLYLSGWQERGRISEYLEEDIGRKVESLWESGFSYRHVYRLWDQPDLTFTAQTEGERDLAAGQLGYTTNLSNILLTDALETFADEQSCELWFLDEEEYRSSWSFYSSVPKAYCLEVPMWEGEELLTALSDRMEQLEQETWYQTLPLEPFEFHFFYRGFEELTWYTYTSGKPFDRSSLLDCYQNEARPMVCCYLVEESGLGEADFGGAEYRLEARGVVELPSFFERIEPFVRVDGVLAETGETARVYLYSSNALYSLLPEELQNVQSTDEMRWDYFEPTSDADLFHFLSIRRQPSEE